jgi:hypothetical protein
VGRRRRFRLAANVAAGPERSCPRVPLPPLRAVRAGRAHSRRGKALTKPRVSKAERNGLEQKSPDGRPRGRVCLFRLAPERPPVFPTSFSTQGDRGQFFEMARPATGRGDDEARGYPDRMAERATAGRRLSGAPRGGPAARQTAIRPVSERNQAWRRRRGRHPPRPRGAWSRPHKGCATACRKPGGARAYTPYLSPEARRFIQIRSCWPDGPGLRRRSPRHCRRAKPARSAGRAQDRRR